MRKQSAPEHTPQWKHQTQMNNTARNKGNLRESTLWIAEGVLVRRPTIGALATIKTIYDLYQQYTIWKTLNRCKHLKWVENEIVLSSVDLRELLLNVHMLRKIQTRKKDWKPIKHEWRMQAEEIGAKLYSEPEVITLQGVFPVTCHKPVYAVR